MHDATIHISREAMLAHTIADTLNTTGFNYNHFNEAMANEHRTLQQAWMRLLVNYIQFAASDEYRTDDRNKASKELAIQLNCTLDDMVVYLACI